MNLLVKSKATGRDVVSLSEGVLEYIGFAAYRLTAGEQLPVSSGDREVCLVLLAGHVNIIGEAPGQGALRWDNIGDRQSVFDESAPFAVYLPPDCQVQITALGPVQIAVCTAPGDNTKRVAARLITPDSMRRSVRGRGANTCRVCDILPDTDMVNALLVVEVRTPSGHCSCYPPQKYPPQTLLPENVLEEIYYHQVNPPQGFVFQRVYTDDRRIDQAMAVENNDLVTVPRGHQPVCVPYGHESYYLNVMAGPKRAGQFHDHAPYDGQHDL